MYKINLLIIFIFVVIMIFCPQTVLYTQKNRDVDVYIAGYMRPPKLEVYSYVAGYWKNGKIVDLETKGFHNDRTIANSIFVSGNNVYAAGSIDNVPDRSKAELKTYFAVYWKNGKIFYLTDYMPEAQATSIFVSKKDVFIAGYIQEKKTDNKIAVYWKNNKLIKLTDGKSNAYTTSICVSGEDVYIAGAVTDPKTANAIAVYWKNGKMISLTDGKYFAYATSLVVSGNDVYVAALAFYDETQDIKATAYWKNDKKIILTGKTGTCIANSIFVNGKDVYVLGADGRNLVYWKNGKEEIFFSPNNKNYHFSARAIYVAGNDVYISGEVDAKPVYWINGKLIQFEKQRYLHETKATSIFIK